ncbi:hypothetical protein EJ04DRAFT_557751 [Polyplosphaeria fusca]|uniref:Uncharacterized protein n=1 Tax=Polyplosphaeria fusca TaxID=682080 RepID=A0A9P4QJF9_9PLEO|nr:hypothetical protein EJ04DRAFT_557751 [Polyplosphaeria fusca]
MFKQYFGKESPYAPLFHNTEAPETPEGNLNFSFQGYRSPEGMSDGSSSPSPTPAKPAAPKASSTNEEIGFFTTSSKPSLKAEMDTQQSSKSRKPKRRDPKMRYSFILSEAESPKANQPGLQSSMTIINSSRTVIGAVEEQNKAPIATKGSILSTEQSFYAQELGPREVPGNIGHTIPHERRSYSRPRESIYFDAVENQSSQKVLASIKEDREQGDYSETESPLQSNIPKRRKVDSIPAIGEPEPELKDASFQAEEPPVTDDDDDIEEDDPILVFRPLLRSNKNHLLPCTSATTSQTNHYRQRALTLMRYKESGSIYTALMDRLENMIVAEEQSAMHEHRHAMNACQLAKRLREFLKGIKVGRIMTGEEQELVEHEMEWAEWLVGITRAGVLHVRDVVQGCKCETSWAWEN